MKEELLSSYNLIISNKLKKYNVYELITMYNTNKDKRFRNLACDIIKEIYVDLKNATNHNLNKHEKDSINSGDYYSERNRSKREVLSGLDSTGKFSSNFPEL